MFTSALVGALHVIGFGAALGSVVVRARALASHKDGVLTPEARDRALRADTVWGVSALLLLPTGALRAFAGLEKGSAYYLWNEAFYVKVVLVALILVVEIWPMINLIRWRIALAREKPLDTSLAPAFSVLSWVEAVLLLLVVVTASLVAHGAGAG